MKKIFPLLLVFAIAAACEKKTQIPGKEPDGPDVPPAVEIPEPPQNIVQANLFKVDFFSTLDDASFFITHNVPAIRSHIQSQTAPKPLIYMVDRCDFVTGDENKLLALGTELKYNAFFAQIEPTESVKTNGTGILTLYKAKRYDGFAENGTFMSGLCFSAPLSKAVEMTVYTTKLTDIGQFHTIMKKRSEQLYSDAVIVGTIAGRAKDEVKKYANEKLGLRMEYSGGDKAFDIFVLCHPGFVCRAIKADETNGCPYYRIEIERLN